MVVDSRLRLSFLSRCDEPQIRDERLEAMINAAYDVMIGANWLARRHNVADVANLKMIDDFILVALKQEFKGPKGTVKTEGEREFEVKIDRTAEDGPRYNVRGAIDKTHHIKVGRKTRLKVRDYKGSKKKFDGEKETDNVQSKMYQLALRHLHPEIVEREFDFLFLKFPRAPIQTQPSFTDEELDAFEWRLHYLQQSMEAFGPDDTLDHPAAMNPDNQWLCGREGIKKDGTPMWVCSARNPIDYWVLKEGDDVIDSAFTQEELTPKGTQTVEARHYAGCPVWWSPNGKRRSSQ